MLSRAPIVIGILAVALAFPCAVHHGARAQEPGAPPALVPGQPPPDFGLPDSAGQLVSLSDFRGKAILLSFVSCYTDTCLPSRNAFEDLLAKVGPARLAILTVCSEIPDTLRENGYAGLRERCGPGQRLLIDGRKAISARYLVSEFPTTIVIGPDFTIRELLQGLAPLRDAALRDRIEKMAGQPAP